MITRIYGDTSKMRDSGHSRTVCRWVDTGYSRHHDSGMRGIFGAGEDTALTTQAMRLALIEMK